MKNRIRRIIKRISILLEIDAPKIIFTNEAISYYTYGVIHLSFSNNFKKMLFLALHELRHHYQYVYMISNMDSISNLISYEMNHAVEYKESYIEGDAYFFSSYVMNEILKMDYTVSKDTKDIILTFLKKHSFHFFYRE